MKSPYERFLDDLEGRKVTLSRANASDVTGTVSELRDDGCIIVRPASTPGNVLHTFVAYDDIRSVEEEGTDYDNM